MSYIHCYNVNNYKPSESLKNLFDELVLQPFNNHSPTPTWVTEVKNKENKYHREKILDRGRTDFDTSFNGLSPDDKVLLYCVYYMPMHLYSSYHIFSSKLRLPESNKVIFIDFGCGPLTSGIAFWAATGQKDITYIGIDRSLAMLDKAQVINQYGSENIHRPFFEKVHFISDFVELPHLLDNVEMGNPNNTLIIFNFCYILASHTFDDNEILDSLLGVINRVANEYEKHKIYMVYQNPVRKQFQKNWSDLKSGIISYSSQFNTLDISEQNSTKEGLLEYETLWGKLRLSKISYDSFNNFSHLEHYSYR